MRCPRCVRTVPLLLLAALTCATTTAQSPNLTELQQQLRHKDPAKRLAAAQELGRRGAAAAPAAGALGSALADAVPDVRNAAGDALGSIGKKAQPILAKALTEDDRLFGALRAVALLGADAVPLLPAITKLWRQEKMEIDQAIEPCLVTLGVTALPHLIQCLGDEHDAIHACDVLARMRALAKPATPALLRALTHRGTLAQPNAADALGAIGDPAVVPDLIKAVQEGLPRIDAASSTIATHAARALGAIGPAAAPLGTPVLLEVLRGTRADLGFSLMQQGAVIALGDLGAATPDVTAALTALADKATGDLARMAKETLAELTLPPGCDENAILRGLVHRNPSLRALALQRLATRSEATTTVLDQVLARLHDSEPELRLAAIGLLVKWGARGETVFKALDDAQHDADPKVATAAKAAREQLTTKGE